ncbi:MAG: chitobiase/beta-hexosaminidase C-terminal domain-containing protein [Bacteroidales bacterium]|nr:chitobiase/beta-hexosaminidase C-terminal domain-containing protein [Bacteroidales bacterium]
MKKILFRLQIAAVLLAVLLFAQLGHAQITLAGWTFPTIDTPVPDSFVAECGAQEGTATLYADGTHGSSAWAMGSISSTTGQAPAEALCEQTAATRALTFQKTASFNGNDSCFVIAISMSGYRDLMITYSTRGTAQGFTDHEWSYSTDGINFTDGLTLTGRNVTTFSDQTVDLSSATVLNNEETVYLRLRFTGATNTSGSSNNRIDNICITANSDVPQANMPVFSEAGGNHCSAFMLEMSCTTENASIYYTLDGTTPDNTNGTLYTGPISIENTTTVQAIAYAEGLGASMVRSTTYTLPTAVNTVAEFKAATDGTFCRIDGDVTVIHQVRINNNYNTFIQDASAAVMIFTNSSPGTYTNGNILTGGVCGVRSTYGTTIELTNPEFVNPTALAGEPVMPTDVTLAELHTNWADYDARLVRLSSVTLSQDSIVNNTNSFCNIFQGNDTLRCANSFLSISGFKAHNGNYEVTGIALSNSQGNRLAPRNLYDIVEMNPTLTIVSPEDTRIYEQGEAISVDIETEYFNFENGSLIKLELSGAQSITYYCDATMLALVESQGFTTLPVGDYTFSAALVNADSTEFSPVVSDTISFTITTVYVAIETSESELNFTETGESHTFTATAFRLTDAITLTVDDNNFTVAPATLAANAQGETVTVTFTGTATASATLTLASGSTTATVALNAVIPIDEAISTIGFENDEGFISAGSNYQNDDYRYQGPDGAQWAVYHGTVNTSGAISGAQSMQMRTYMGSTSPHYGHLGHTFTNYDLHNVTSVDFYAKTSSNDFNVLTVSCSFDGGETFVMEEQYTLSTDVQRFSYFVSDSGQHYSVRIKFAQTMPEEIPSSGTYNLYLDSVVVFGVPGLEPSVVETPVLSEQTGNFLNPISVSITCATEDAAIYYTTDGNTPTQDDNLYTAPISISSSCTLKAKAFKGGMDPSNVATAVYTFPEEVANIAAFKAANSATNSTPYKITGDVTFVYRHNRYIYIQDASAGLLVYDNSTPVITNNYTEGDIISGGIIGTYTLYNGLSEMVPLTDWAESTENNGPVTPVTITGDQLINEYDTYESRLVRIDSVTFPDGVEFNTSAASNANFTDASTEEVMILRNNFTTLDTVIEANATAHIIGFATIYANSSSTSYQIVPRTNDDIITIVPEDTNSVQNFTVLPMTVFPNPTTDKITVNADITGGTLEIVNAFGQVIYHNDTPSYPMTISLSGQSAGLYFIRVITADQKVGITKISKL